MKLSHFSVALLVAASMLTVATISPGNMQVGDKPTLKFKAFASHKSIDLADLKGKIVVVDFWATWCGPCMGEAAHMVQVNEQYAPKGLQFIGISLDQDPSSLTKIIKEKNFTWPMSYEGAGWEGSLPKGWGVNSIPQTFIIGPDGTVLWRGHPANIDAALATAFKEHPPQLVDPATLACANKILDQVDSDISGGESARAVKLLATVPSEAAADGDFSSRLKTTTDKLVDYGNSQLTEVDGLIQSRDYTAANAKLRDLSQAFTGLPVSAAAKKKLAQMNANPTIRAELAAEKKLSDSSAALEAANQLKSTKKDDLAYPRFDQIVKEYPGTPAAAEAADAVKAYRSDPAFMKLYAMKTGKKRAEAALSMAEMYKSSGNNVKAKAKYQEVVDSFPGTPWAETATKEMAALTDASNSN